MVSESMLGLPAATVDRPASVLIVAHAWYGDMIGGSFRLASEFARWLAAGGHRVSYLCCAPEARLATDWPSVEEGVAVWRYPPPPRWLGPGRWAWHVRETRRWAGRIVAERPITVLNGHSPLQFYGAAQTVHGSGVARHYTVHSPFDDEVLCDTRGRGGLLRRAAAGVARRLEKNNLRTATRIHTISRYTLDSLAGKHGPFVLQKGSVSPGWVDTSHFRPTADRAGLRESLGADWPQQVPVFFTLRRLEARMGLDTLVRAAAELRRRTGDFRVLIGGQGSLRGELARMIGDLGLSQHVRLLGRVPEQQLAACYAAADCFVLPTRALECFGLIVLESFAAGVPVIGTRVAAIPEIAALQGEQWLFPPGDVAGLAAAMGDFLDGTLRPERDLRAIACRYDRRSVLAAWERLCLTGNQDVDKA